MPDWKRKRKALGIHCSSRIGTQIDLLFDRDDDAVTICEIKYTEKLFVITKSYSQQLENKVRTYQVVTKTKK
jgi:hypothetical protein